MWLIVITITQAHIIKSFPITFFLVQWHAAKLVILLVLGIKVSADRCARIGQFILDLHSSLSKEMLLYRMALVFWLSTKKNSGKM